MSAPIDAVLVIVPTYDEIDNLGPLLDRLHLALPSAHVLVVDDNSPDGTGKLADERAHLDPRVQVMHRLGKGGLGAAYLAGFAWGLGRGYDVLVEMDADGSHRPEQLPALLAAVQAGADLALGSRWVPGGSVVNWPLWRSVLSRGGNLYTRVALGLPLHDATGGFRAFRSSTLSRLDLDDVSSQGYCFQVDLAWRATRSGFRVVEVPITFVERERGESKMSGGIVREALWRVSMWGARYRVTQLARAVRRRPRNLQ